MLLYLILNTFSVYFASQVLQGSKYIRGTSHDKITQNNITYNALYSVLVVLGLHSLQQIQINSRKGLFVYTLCCHLGAMAFALGGEYGPLRDFSITPGFWHRLSPIAKLIVSAIFLLVFILFAIQGLRAKRKKTCYKQWWPWAVLFVTWLILWLTILKDHFYVHVHHALFAGLFTCWFSDFQSKLDLIVNAILTGIVIEGIDFYGIGELSLFIFFNQPLHDITLILSWLAVVIGLVCTILYKSPVPHNSNKQIDMIDLK